MTDAGPMPLAEARALLRGSQAFVKGEGVLDGQRVLASDLMWQALLSLADAAEFVEVASRLRWEFHPRGFDNTDLYQRYGDGIVPWLATFVDDDGVLHNVPWCVGPCLLACGSAEAFTVVWRVRDVAGRTGWGGFRDGDPVIEWCARHPEVGRAELTRRAAAEPRARTYLRALGVAPTGPVAAGDILALLDACAGRMFPTRVVLWPAADTPGVRAVAARDGAAWGLALERVDGTRPTGMRAARVVTFAYGSQLAGAAPGVAIASRPVPDLGADDLDRRLGAPTLALPALGLAPTATIVATVPHLAVPARPSESPVLVGLAEALAAHGG